MFEALHSFQNKKGVLVLCTQHQTGDGGDQKKDVEGGVVASEGQWKSVEETTEMHLK